MSKYLRLLALSALLTTFTPQAHAEHYAGIGMGALQLDAGVGKKSAFGGYIQVGHEFMPYLGAEIRLGAGSRVSLNNEKMQLDWIVAHFLKPYVEVADGLQLYALGGFSVNHTSLQVGTAAKLRKTNISFSYGAGAQYDIGNNLRLGAEWVSYAREAAASSRTTSFQGLNITGYMATLKYAF